MHYYDWKPVGIEYVQRALQRGGRLVPLPARFGNAMATYTHGLVTKRGSCFLVSDRTYASIERSDHQTEVNPQMSTTGKRTAFFDGDFRRQPKTSCFCCVCQRDLDPDSVDAWLYLGEDPCQIVHPEDLDGSEIRAPIGKECRRVVPGEYLSLKK